MEKKWNDNAAGVIYSCTDVLEKFAALLKNDITMIAEKERSLGYLNESMSDIFSDLTINQYPKAKEVLNAFINSLSQIEFGRKVMYQRSHQLAQSSFTSTLDLAKKAKSLLKEREASLSKYMQVKAAKEKSTKPSSQLDEKLTASKTSFQAANAQAIQATSTFTNQLHRDLILTLSSFAHAQMEFYAREIEVWSKTIEAIDKNTIDDDTESIVNSFQASFRQRRQ
ncbi:hypothetical protein GPJ56_001532 [Histomonas meleagridis]|uniref:uncharacterized protein n=1 Tax=Histomonas meleagridis TaxID=135588 RepID=UPI0035597FB1|nr:hypothetical protein GPJ56_001532 [Histomonas meleagridis]KAH0807039.1 hypothetical protein GO595_000215 [Histomonas meleagridis]